MEVEGWRRSMLRSYGSRYRGELDDPIVSPFERRQTETSGAIGHNPAPRRYERTAWVGHRALVQRIGAPFDFH